MGYGEVVGNESVHWTIAHEDERGGPVGLSAKQGQAQHPKSGHDVHIDRTARGCDPIAIETVGRRKGHTGKYRVRLRFERAQDAAAAAASLQQITENGMHVLVLDVPVIRRKDPDEGPAPEIRIDW